MRIDRRPALHLGRQTIPMMQQAYRGFALAPIFRFEHLLGQRDEGSPRSRFSKQQSGGHPLFELPLSRKRHQCLYPFLTASEQ